MIRWTSALLLREQHRRACNKGSTTECHSLLYKRGPIRHRENLFYFSPAFLAPQIFSTSTKPHISLLLDVMSSGMCLPASRS